MADRTEKELQNRLNELSKIGVTSFTDTLEKLNTNIEKTFGKKGKAIKITEKYAKKHLEQVKEYLEKEGDALKEAHDEKINQIKEHLKAAEKEKKEIQENFERVKKTRDSIYYDELGKLNKQNFENQHQKTLAISALKLQKEIDEHKAKELDSFFQIDKKIANINKGLENTTKKHESSLKSTTAEYIKLEKRQKKVTDGVEKFHKNFEKSFGNKLASAVVAPMGEFFKKIPALFEETLAKVSPMIGGLFSMFSKMFLGLTSLFVGNIVLKMVTRKIEKMLEKSTPKTPKTKTAPDSPELKRDNKAGNTGGTTEPEEKPIKEKPNLTPTEARKQTKIAAFFEKTRAKTAKIVTGGKDAGTKLLGGIGKGIEKLGGIFTKLLEPILGLFSKYMLIGIAIVAGVVALGVGLMKLYDYFKSNEWLPDFFNNTPEKKKKDSDKKYNDFKKKYEDQKAEQDKYFAETIDTGIKENEKKIEKAQRDGDTQQVEKLKKEIQILNTRKKEERERLNKIFTDRGLDLSSVKNTTTNTVANATQGAINNAVKIPSIVKETMKQKDVESNKTANNTDTSKDKTYVKQIANTVVKDNTEKTIQIEKEKTQIARDSVQKNTKIENEKIQSEREEIQNKEKLIATQAASQTTTVAQNTQSAPEKGSDGSENILNKIYSLAEEFLRAETHNAHRTV